MSTQATQRLLRGKPGTLIGTLTDSQGDPVAAGGTVTAGVVSASGATILAPGAATTPAGDTGVYQVAVTAAQTALLDRWVATWIDSAGNTEVTAHEVCGGFLFGLAEVRASDLTLNDTSKYPDSAILDLRQAVEDEVEFICDVAFVPRYRRVILDGTATVSIYVPDSRVTLIRSVAVIQRSGQSIWFTTAQLAALNAQLPGDDSDDFQLQRNDGGIWDEGRRNVIIEYECGYPGPPLELKKAGLRRLRYSLNQNKTAIPDRASSFITEGGTLFKLDSADAFKTGINDIDAVYSRYSTRRFGDQGLVPVSRPVDTDPSWFSVFHGGRR